jgi:hypothetical protein
VIVPERNEILSTDLAEFRRKRLGDRYLICVQVRESCEKHIRIAQRCGKSDPHEWPTDRLPKSSRK